MLRLKFWFCLLGTLSSLVGFGGGLARAASPSFTLSAYNTTMPSNGGGNLPFTLMSVNGYTGTVNVSCVSTNAPVGALVPYCASLPMPYTLGADASVTGSIYLTQTPAPGLGSNSALKKSQNVSLAAVVGFILCGLGFRQARKGLGGVMLAVALTLIVVEGLSGCGASRPGLTPGKYVYTLKAIDTTTQANVTTTATVTVP